MKQILDLKTVNSDVYSQFPPIIKNSTRKIRKVTSPIRPNLLPETTPASD